MKDIFININNTLQETLAKLQTTSSRCLIAVNNKNMLMGTINDGDIRRAILNKAKLNFKISKYIHKKCYYLKEKNLSNIMKLKIEKKFEKLGINIIPIIDENKKVINYISSKIEKEKKSFKYKKNYGIIIMAGGFGTRLKPYTNILPKPLLPFKNKTIIENVIDKFVKFGIKNFLISLNYKNILMKSFFKELKPNYKVSFLEESKPLGTAGVLYKLRNKNKNFFISNCDVIMDLNYNDLAKFHDSKKFDITIVVSLQRDRIPYGVCKAHNDQLQNIKEKPEKNYLANTGFYVVNSRVFNLIKDNENTSFIDLINRALIKKMKIGIFPISSNAWIDLGQSAEFIRNKNE